MFFLFFLTAALYASAGLAGGTTYLALLLLAGYSYDVIPQIALLLNIAVALGSVIRFRLAGVVRIRKVLPLIIFSVPAAFIGGQIPVPKDIFLILLGISLFFAGIRLLWMPSLGKSQKRQSASSNKVLAGVCAVIGFVSGLVGIGGGIFLGPVLYFIKWNEARVVAAICSFFILANSMAGLMGQFLKSGIQIEGQWLWGLIAVVLGGQLGNRATLKVLSPIKIQQITGFLVVIVSLKIFVDLGRSFF